MNYLTKFHFHDKFLVSKFHRIKFSLIINNSNKKNKNKRKIKQSGKIYYPLPFILSNFHSPLRIMPEFSFNSPVPCFRPFLENNKTKIETKKKKNNHFSFINTSI